MATCTKIKPAQTGNWSDTFPKHQVTQQESLSFVKKLLAVAVSHITYLRVVFPESAFCDRAVEDLKLKILKNNKSCPGACLVIEWLRGAFDALDKKYLRVLVLGVYKNPEDPDTMIEAYTFKFSYSDTTAMDIYKNEEKISSTNTGDKTKQATIALLRTLVILMQTLQPLPHDYMLTMKLLYYDEVTPAHYEPPGFKAADTDIIAFEDKPMKIRVGNVSTLFHALKMRVTTDYSRLKGHSVSEDFQDSCQDQHIALEGLDTADEVQKCHQLPLEANTLYNSAIMHEKSQTVGVHDPEVNLLNVAPKQAILSSNNMTFIGQVQKDPVSATSLICTTEKKSSALVQNTTRISELPPADDQDKVEHGVRCACGCSEDDGVMILCDVCGHWQHGLCFLIEKVEDAPEQHICHICCNPSVPNLRPTDPALVGLSGEDLQMTCLWRRTLIYCTKEKTVTVNSLTSHLGVAKVLVAQLMQRLEMEEYVKPARGKLSKQTRVVNVERLKKDGIRKYFQRSPVLKENDMQTVIAGNPNFDLSTCCASWSLKDIIPDQPAAIQMKSNPCQNGKQIPKPKTSKAGKRMRSTTEDVYDFEVSNTQEDYEKGQQNGKRLKSSTSTKHLKH